MTTSNYSELQKNYLNPDSKVVVERAKVAGHYISIYEPYPNDPVEELFASVISQNNRFPSSFIIKYSHYVKENPYKFI